VLILLDDAPGQRMRMTELAAGVLLSRSGARSLLSDSARPTKSLSATFGRASAGRFRAPTQRDAQSLSQHGSRDPLQPSNERAKGAKAGAPLRSRHRPSDCGGRWCSRTQPATAPHLRYPCGSDSEPRTVRRCAPPFRHKQGAGRAPTSPVRGRPAADALRARSPTLRSVRSGRDAQSAATALHRFAGSLGLQTRRMLPPCCHEPSAGTCYSIERTRSTPTTSWSSRRGAKPLKTPRRSIARSSAVTRRTPLGSGIARIRPRSCQRSRSSVEISSPGRATRSL